MFPRPLILIATLAVCSLPIAAKATEMATAVPVDGERFTARAVSLDAAGQLTFEKPDGRQTLALDDLVRWGNPPETRGGSLLVLGRGAVVVVGEVSLENSRVSFGSALLGEGSLATEDLRGLVLESPSSPQLKDKLIERISTHTGDSDRLLLTNGDELSGTITAIDPLDITINANVGEIDVARNRVEAVLLNSTFFDPGQADATGIWVGLSDGSRILAARAEMNAETLTLAMPEQTTWQAPAASLVWLQPLGARVVYLSDLEAAGYRHIPLLNLSWEFARDRNVLGTTLRSGERRYEKGLGMHSACRLTYRLDEPFSRFEADLAVDDAAGALGSVVFRVYVGTEQRFASDTIRSGDPPVPISVDISGGRSLSLLVEFAERGDVQDYADWLDARLVR